MTDNTPTTPTTPQAQTSVRGYSDAAYTRGVVSNFDAPAAPPVVSQHFAVTAVNAPTGYPQGSVLATARDAIDEPTTKLTPDTRVTVNNVAMRLSAAVKEGFVRQNPDGSYADVSPSDYNAKLAAAAQLAEAQAVGSRIAIHPQADSDMRALMDGLAKMGQDPLSVMAEMAGNHQWHPAFDALATRWDVPAPEMKARVGGVLSALASVIDHTLLAPEGIDRSDWDAWVGKNVPRFLHNRAFLHAFAKGDLTGYRQMLGQYKLSDSYRNGTKIPAGVQSYVNEKGQTLVRFPGFPDMSVGAARNLGLL